jgi:hypothetical protein
MHCSIRRLYLPLAVVAAFAVGIAAFAAPSTPWVTTGFPVAQASFAKLPAARS